MLVHEHVLVGFVEQGALTPDMYDRNEVIAAILPLLSRLIETGCDLMADCAPQFLGRDPYVLRELSELSGVRLVTNTGLYKSPYLPDYAYALPERELSALWTKEALDGIGESGVYPGFIKIALNDGAVIEEIQRKLLRAAMRTSLETGLPIQCHTIEADIAEHAYEIMKQSGFEQQRFIWVNAQTFLREELYRKLAEEGGWLSVDSIRMESYKECLDLLRLLSDIGAGDRILLSQDTGWFNVGQPGGGEIHPYHRLFTEFLPAAAADGLDPQWLERCVSSHAFEAMSKRN
ncbi:hypothetical protein MO973_21985 [Paenibacillus sp. TRM 82003]|nr:hypothetical protein [Paenibacillus sp. TRM 82003]